MDFGRVRRGELLKKVIVLENIPVPYELQYKNVKRINLRVHRDGRVCVSAGHFVPQRQIDTFLTQNSGFILQTLERFRKMREAGDGMAAGKNRIYEDGDTLYLKGIPYRLRVVEGKKEEVAPVGRVLLLTQKDVHNAGRRKRMLDAFLNIRYRGNTWFDGMSIRDDRGSDVFRNAFPVIRIDLNSISVEDQDELERSMDRLVGSAFRDHSYLESSERLPRYMRSDYSRMARSEYGSDVLDLFQLSEMLQVHHGAQAVVLVDGYDSPVVSSIGKPCFQEVRNLTGRMLLSVLKDNPHVGKAFLMGVCCVSYPGLNNLALSTTMDGADSRTASA